MDRHLIRNVSASIAFVLTTATAAAGEPEYLGPTPYTSRADSPFDTAAFGFRVQDFESGVSLFATGARLWPSGDLLEPGNLTDSVDEDDGAVDGSGVTSAGLLHRNTGFFMTSQLPASKAITLLLLSAMMAGV